MCGKTLCCSSWISDFGVVSIKMAKEQDLPLNPSKISGVCGRLLCCLAYENDNYIQAKQNMPQIGTFLDTPGGQGKVVSVNVPKESVEVMLESGVIIQVPLAQQLSVSSCPKCGAEGGCKGACSTGGCGTCGGGAGGCSKAKGCGTCGIAQQKASGSKKLQD